ELQPDERRLLADGMPVHVGRHAFDLLVTLVERSGHLVTKEELFGRVWGSVVVEENTMQSHVAALRKVLGASAITTVSGHGYRFTPEVSCVGRSPRQSAATPRNNLPHQLTSFVGRAYEIAQLKQLAVCNRLVTLTGAGGCGKSRLALQLAGELLD